MPACVDGEGFEAGVDLKSVKIGMTRHAPGRLIGGGVVSDAVLRLEGDEEAALGIKRQTFGVAGLSGQRLARDGAQALRFARRDRGDAPRRIAGHAGLKEIGAVGDGDQTGAPLEHRERGEAAEGRIIHRPAIAAQIGGLARLPGLGCQRQDKAKRRNRP